jgi:glycosyltransferase involved in cell wall biosynthesis
VGTEQRGLCVVVSADVTVRAFLLNHIQALSEHYQVTVSANCPDSSLKEALPVTVRFARNGVVRPISPLQDLREVLRLARFFRHDRFWAVHTVTPKAGLLGMIAARLARVPVRVHTFTGQVWATRTGANRTFLKVLDRVIVACATECIIDSGSQRDFLVSEHVLGSHAGTVLGRGSIAGVDTHRFHPDPDARRQVRAQLGVSDDAVVCLFVGRLNHDKGVLDLAHAFVAARSKVPNLELVLVGADEEELSGPIRRITSVSSGAVHIVGGVNDPERYMAAADIFCLPSYREGFGMSVIEAGACGVPAVTSRIYGLTDAVVENVTGLFHPVGDTAALADRLERLAADPNLRRELGDGARHLAETDFRADVVSQELVEFYGRFDRVR